VRLGLLGLRYIALGYIWTLGIGLRFKTKGNMEELKIGDVFYIVLKAEWSKRAQAYRLPRIDIEESPDMEWRPAPDFKEEEL